MPDNKYCYPGSDVLKNKLGITDADELFEVEKELTSIRLQELEMEPVNGDFSFQHLRKIHKYIFQDIYDWAGEIRTVEIGKGNLFCTTSCIHEYSESLFAKYFKQCYSVKDNIRDFINALAINYGDLNALHPFREGNGRAQREFARLLCLECGYDFCLACTTHKKMLAASKLSFDKGDNSGLIEIFSEAVKPLNTLMRNTDEMLRILTADDLIIGTGIEYDYYSYDEYENEKLYTDKYKEKITKMNSEKIIE